MASQTVTALFDTYEDAAQAVRRVEAAGVPRGDISLVANNTDARHSSHVGGETAEDAGNGAGAGATLGTLLGGGAGLLAGLGLLAVPGVGPVVAAGWLVATLTGAGLGAAAGGLAGSLTGAGMSEADAHTYAEGVRRGGTLVTVRSDEALAGQVAGILDEHGSIDIDERAQTWRGEGWRGPSSAAAPTGASAPAGAIHSDPVQAGVGQAKAVGGGTNPGAQEAIPIVEERLAVGKRVTEHGRVRIHAHVVEQPVTEQVALRGETVHVDRQTADRPLAADEAAFRERTVEVVERDEVPVVSKEARVVEEIGLRKEVSDRVETVTDKVRRTEVEVEDERGRIEPAAPAAVTRPVR